MVYIYKVDSHLMTWHDCDPTVTQQKDYHIFSYNDTTTTRDTALQVLPELLLLSLCYQDACSRMFSQEELICIVDLLDGEEKRKLWKNRWILFWNHLTQRKISSLLRWQAFGHRSTCKKWLSVLSYRKMFLIMLLFIADAHYRFTKVDIGSYRKNWWWNIFEFKYGNIRKFKNGKIG